MSKALKVIILVGIPASGKSTFAIDCVKNNPNYVIVSRDSFRFMLRNEPFCDSKVEELITELMEVTIVKSLVAKRNVIIDNTNVKLKYINQFTKLVSIYADVEFKLFDVDVNTCIERDMNRSKAPVGMDVIVKMFSDLEILKQNFNFEPIKMVKNRPTIMPEFDSDKQKAVIFDIDGTLAVIGNRSPYDTMNAGMDIDNQIVSEQIEFHSYLDRKIILLSGRSEEFREVTTNWLYNNYIEFDELHMRSDNDNRKDFVIKREIYDSKIKDRFNVLCVYDDRLSVIKMWNKIGLFVFNVNQGNVEF